LAMHFAPPGGLAPSDEVPRGGLLGRPAAVLRPRAPRDRRLAPSWLKEQRPANTGRMHPGGSEGDSQLATKHSPGPAPWVRRRHDRIHPDASARVLVRRVSAPDERGQCTVHELHAAQDSCWWIRRRGSIRPRAEYRRRRRHVRHGSSMAPVRPHHSTVKEFLAANPDTTRGRRR
jgi:hypothetical protein